MNTPRFRTLLMNISESSRHRNNQCISYFNNYRALSQAQSAAARKLEAVKLGHATQISSFDVVKEKREAQARAIQDNIGDVDMLILTLRGLLAGGMDWRDLGGLVKKEQRAGNAIAKMVRELRLDAGVALVRLAVHDEEYDSEDSDSDEGDAEGTYIDVDIDINLSAYANCSRLFQQKKVAVVKQQKTIQAAGKGMLRLLLIKSCCWH
jgi:predicted ribosome quality control (RQC) complex YloA/Tae2 family protein